MKKNEIKISTIIGEGAVCKGDFSAEKSVRIDGIIHGSVAVSGILIVGASGQIDGDVTAKAVIIGGKVNGNVSGPEKVELTSTATVIGDINTNVIVIDENAVFQGKCNMQTEEIKEKSVSVWEMRSQRKSAKAAIAEVLKEIYEEENAADSVTTEQSEESAMDKIKEA